MIWHQKILGNQSARDYLESIAESPVLPNAFLFVGPRDVGKYRIAKDFAKLLNKSNIGMMREIDKNLSPYVVMMGDLWQAGRLEDWDRIALTSNFDQQHRTGTDGEAPRRTNTIGVRDIHSFLRPLSHSAAVEWKVGIIRNADRMTGEAANALLKTLEEPPTRTIFLLTTTHENNLPETIVSRCQILRFGLVPRKILSEFLETRPLQPQVRQEMLTISQGRSETLHRFLDDPEFFEAEQQLFQRISRCFFAPDWQKIAFANELSDFEEPQILLDFLNNLTRFLRSILVEKVMGKELEITRKVAFRTILDLLEKIEATKRGLAANANRKLLMEDLFFSFP